MNILKKMCSKFGLAGSKKVMASKRLAVFDFDHTIVEENTDVVVLSLLKNGVPEKVKALHSSQGWTAFMQAIFDILHEEKVSPCSIAKKIQSLDPVVGMPELIRELNQNMNSDVIIISDSNSFFIDTWLKHYKLDSYILKVFTNPAVFENGHLKIEMYHLQDYCKLSTKNLCKGQILEDFISCQKASNVVYEKVIFTGDGMNDFCPILRLNSYDLACVRAKYKCANLVQEAIDGKSLDEDGKPRKINAKVCVWKNGFEIIDFIKEHFQ